MVHSDCGGKCIRHNHAPDRAADPANWRTSCLSASLMRDASRKVADSCSNAAPRIFETAAAGIRRGLTKLRSQCPSTQNFLCGATAPHPAWDEFTPLNSCSHLETHRIWATCLGDPGPLADAHDVGRDPPCGGLPDSQTHTRAHTERCCKATVLDRLVTKETTIIERRDPGLSSMWYEGVRDHAKVVTRHCR